MIFTRCQLHRDRQSFMITEHGVSLCRNCARQYIDADCLGKTPEQERMIELEDGYLERQADAFGGVL